MAFNAFTASRPLLKSGRFLTPSRLVLYVWAHERLNLINGCSDLRCALSCCRLSVIKTREPPRTIRSGGSGGRVAATVWVATGGGGREISVRLEVCRGRSFIVRNCNYRRRRRASCWFVRFTVHRDRRDRER